VPARGHRLVAAQCFDKLPSGCVAAAQDQRDAHCGQLYAQPEAGGQGRRAYRLDEVAGGVDHQRLGGADRVAATMTFA
jgi:hypothetical protein